MRKIEIRRMFLMYLEFFSDSPSLNLLRKPYGITKLLLTMVESANVETTTIEITAENPPRKTKVAKKVFPYFKGSNSVK